MHVIEIEDRDGSYLGISCASRDGLCFQDARKGGHVGWICQHDRDLRLLQGNLERVMALLSLRSVVAISRIV